MLLFLAGSAASQPVPVPASSESRLNASGSGVSFIEYSNSSSLLDCGPSCCEDDLGWSLNGEAEFNCSWYALNDPGCAILPDLGQMDGCPLTCGRCTTDDPTPHTNNETAPRNETAPSVDETVSSLRSSGALVRRTPEPRAAALIVSDASAPLSTEPLLENDTRDNATVANATVNGTAYNGTAPAEAIVGAAGGVAGDACFGTPCSPSQVCLVTSSTGGHARCVSASCTSVLKHGCRLRPPPPARNASNTSTLFGPAAPYPIVCSTPTTPPNRPSNRTTRSCDVETCSAGPAFCVGANLGASLEGGSTFVASCDGGPFPYQVYPAMEPDTCAVVLPHTVVTGLVSMGGAQWKSYSSGANYIEPIKEPPSAPPPAPSPPPSPPASPPLPLPPASPPAQPPPQPSLPPGAPVRGDARPTILVAAAMTVLVFVVISICICAVAVRHVKRVAGRAELQKRSTATPPEEVLMPWQIEPVRPDIEPETIPPQ